VNQSGIDKLRDMISYFNACSEHFVQRYSLVQLITLHNFVVENQEPDYPDTWDEAKLHKALHPRK